MGPPAKQKQQAMPSALRSIQRTVAAVDNYIDSSARGTSNAVERQSLIANHPTSSPTADDPSGSAGVPAASRMSTRHKKMKRVMDSIASRLQMQSRGQNIGFRRDMHDATGKKYRVEIPKNLIVMVLVAFFVLPLVLGLYVLFRQLFQGEEVRSRYGQHPTSHPDAPPIINATVPMAENDVGVEAKMSHSSTSDPDVRSKVVNDLKEVSKKEETQEIMVLETEGSNEGSKDNIVGGGSVRSNLDDSEKKEITHNALVLHVEEMENSQNGELAEEIIKSEDVSTSTTIGTQKVTEIAEDIDGKDSIDTKIQVDAANVNIRGETQKVRIGDENNSTEDENKKSKLSERKDANTDIPTHVEIDSISKNNQEISTSPEGSNEEGEEGR